VNGFVQFDEADALERFFRDPEVVTIASRAKLTRSTREPLAIFQHAEAEDVEKLKDVAEREGGTVTGSRQYGEA
jgi:hypothetical protein